MHEQPRDAAPRIPPRRHRADQPLERPRLPRLFHQPVLEPLAHAADGGERSSVEEEETGEEGTEQEGLAGEAVGKGCHQSCKAILWHYMLQSNLRLPLRGSRRFQRRPYRRRTGKASMNIRIMVICSHALYKYGFHFWCKLSHRSQILHPENIIRRSQHLGGDSRPLCDLAAHRDGIRRAILNPLMHRGLERIIIHARRGFFQRFDMFRLGPERQRIDAAEPCEALHAACRKVLSAAAGEGVGELEHQIRPAAHGPLRPRPLVRDGCQPALRKAAAHADDNRGIRAELPDFRQLVNMAVVERIVLGDQANGGNL